MHLCGFVVKNHILKFALPLLLTLVVPLAFAQPQPATQLPTQTPPAAQAAPRALSDVPVIGAMSPSQQNVRLAAMGAITPEQSQKNNHMIKQHQNEYLLGIGDLFGGGKHKSQPWGYTSHQFGFMPLLTSSSPALLAIKQAATISPDSTLQNAQIRITLDRLRVFEYPGNGRHKVLFTFSAQNAIGSGTTASTETPTFSQNYEVLQGQGAGIAGYPVFIGLHVPGTGVAFQVHTTNVSNDNDEKVMSFLNGSTFQSGLKLLDTANPAIPIVSGFAVGLLKDFESRNENVGVEDFFMGLDFGSTVSGVRVAQGSYIVVQAPDDGWNWGDWVWDVARGTVVSKANSTPIPFNYVVFSVQKM